MLEPSPERLRLLVLLGLVLLLWLVLLLASRASLLRLLRGISGVGKLVDILAAGPVAAAATCADRGT